jgi:predicted nucleic acid-binding protein
MKPMNDKVFLDTNILVYAYSNTEPDKQGIARNLITEHKSYVSTQVLQKLTNILTKRFYNSWQEARNVVLESCENNLLYINEKNTVVSACGIADKYKYSFYDSLIIAAALECGCTTLYSEDMHDGQVIEDTLTVINPFK